MARENDSKAMESKEVRPRAARLLSSPIFWVAIGAVFYWLSLPPMRQPWCAYVACGCWASQVSRNSVLTGRHYFRIWCCGLVLWLMLLQGIRLAFWPLYAGWGALAAYVACYLPLFIASARSLHHRFRFSLSLACAFSWVGWELVRSYFATGFSACMLAHSQTPWPWALQWASHLGAYGVSWMVMLMGAAVVEAWQIGRYARGDLRRQVALVSSITALSATLVMMLGSSRMLFENESRIQEQSPIKPLGRVLLVQDNMPTFFDGDLGAVQASWKDYETRTIDALKASPEPIDLVVWPESVFTAGYPWIEWDHGNQVPDEFEGSLSQLENTNENLAGAFEQKKFRILRASSNPKVSLIVGNDVWRIRGGKLDRYNAALWWDGTHQKGDFYGKQHLVMFGEYIPFASNFPSLMKAIQLGTLSQGEMPKAWSLGNGVVVSASICFEDVLPHLIQSQISQLTQQGLTPDLLVNITNDGWFRGSSILDHHLNNAILCAVENRRPMLIAANSGISAWVDGNGRVVQSIDRLTSGTIVAEPIPDGRWGLWQSIGDWPARYAAIVAVFPFCLGLVEWLYRRRKTKATPSVG